MDAVVEVASAARDYEQQPLNSETFILIAMIGLTSRRLACKM